MTIIIRAIEHMINTNDNLHVYHVTQGQISVSISTLPGHAIPILCP